MTPLLTHWSYVFLALTHQYRLANLQSPSKFLFLNKAHMDGDAPNFQACFTFTLHIHVIFLMMNKSSSLELYFLCYGISWWGIHVQSTCFQDIISHYSDVMISMMASQITSVLIVNSTICSSANQRKYQISASLTSVRGINRWPGNSPHKGPVTWKMFPFD